MSALGRSIVARAIVARAIVARAIVARAIVLGVLAHAASVALPASVRAEFPAFVHVVREGETLASIAQRYYGDPRPYNQNL